MSRLKHHSDQNSRKLQKWIRTKAGARAKLLREFIHAENQAEQGITHALHGAGSAALRRKLVAALKLK
ncbi:MAG: hypothetical protein HY043_06405 [Verrucomicrobia bacterium]|nr:hypothetical protein [Verrucomicrobiota bacterium]